MPVKKCRQEHTTKQVIKLQNGTFIGHCIGDWPPHGIGKFIYKSGNVYEGEWQNGMMHGRGTYTYSDGDVYEGEWKEGKQNGKGTYTYADGSVTVQGSYENDVCIDFEKVIIKDKQGVKHCFFKEGGILYYQKESEDKQEVSAKNKRLEALFIQFGDAEITENNDNVIDCNNPRDFKQEIQKLIEKSQQEKASPTSKIFTIPMHAFTMVFTKGTAYCYDNGAIATHPACIKYKEVLKQKNVEYQEFSMSNKLSVLLADGSKVEISMPKNSLVCRHLACVVFKKIEALISSEDNITKGLKRWSKRSQKEGGEEEEEIEPSKSPLLARPTSPARKKSCHLLG